MPLALEIVPVVPWVNMFGPPDASTNYSLSGHLTLSLESPAPAASTQVAGYQKPETVHLSSLELVFEGKAEMVSSQVGYDGFRICRIAKQLVPRGRRIVLTTEADACQQACSSSSTLLHQWEVVFDLQLPGWLPPTTECGEEGGGTGYSLHATAFFADTEKCSSWSLSSLVNLVRSKPLPPVGANRVPIEITRHRSPPLSSLLDFLSEPGINEPLFHPIDLPATTTIRQVNSSIPIDLLKSLDVVVTVPQHIGCEEKRVAVSLRVRSTLPKTSKLGTLRLNDFEIELNQSEKFSSRPALQYVNAFPVPPEHEQPPYEPLLDPHQWQKLYALGMVSRQDAAVAWTRQTHLLAGDRVRFKPSLGGLQLNEDWAKMDTVVSIDPTTRKSHPKPKGARQLVPTVFTPYMRVKHELRVGLNLAFVPPEGVADRTPIRQMAHATVPLSFVVPSFWSPFGTPSSGSSSPTSSESVTCSTPYLPAYSQLFHDNGEHREDLSGCWLPQYCEQADSMTDLPVARPVASSA